MATLSDDRIAALLNPYVVASAELRESLSELIPKFSQYLDLLLKWNARTNLTAIRQPEEIVTRHFGESVFAADALLEHITDGDSLLDFGSGAGFPGLPIQMCVPALGVCLAESQNKKAAFLREATRNLGLRTEIWMGRVEEMPSTRSFRVVTLRAVDKMELAIGGASKRVADGGFLAILSGPEMSGLTGWQTLVRLRIPESDRRFLTLLRHIGA